MNKIKIGILGYGNLGKAVEKLATKEEEIVLLGIFSKRRNIKSIYNKPVYTKEQLLKFKDKIDLLVICSGSEKDMLVDAPLYAKHFNIINTFDTHALILQEFEKLNDISKQSNHMSIISAGWDPGLFSMIKAAFYSILGEFPVCFWGKGTSLGHSNAVKNIDGVIDAISFTVPETSEISKARLGIETSPNTRHTREVFVTIKANANRSKIENQIKNIENYFKGQHTTVNFVSLNDLEKLKTFTHKGLVIGSKTTSEGLKFSLELSATMSSNSEFTAMIILSYAKAIKKLKTKYPAGAYTPLHFSPLDILSADEKQMIKLFC